MWPRSLVTLLAVAALGPGCGRGGAVAAGVKRAFSTQHSCPAERIKVTLRPELTESLLEARRRRPVADVPDSLKANPELYAKVKAAKDRERAILDEMNAPPKERKPAPEIAADPGRLAVWKQKQAQDQARVDRFDREHPVAAAEGCGQQGLYVCTLAGRRYWCSPSAASP
jgi:hypothetical protein